MICPECKSDKVRFHDKNYTTHKVRMKCSACDHSWSMNKSDVEMGPTESAKPKKVGDVISLGELRKRHDVDFRVVEALKSLKKDEFIDKDTLIRRIGLRHGYPRLSATIDSHKEYFGKADSKIYWGHPDEIALLKEEGTLT